MKYSEKRNDLSWLLKEERVAECLTSWGRLFQVWGPKCEKVRKPIIYSARFSVAVCLLSVGINTVLLLVVVVMVIAFNF